MLTMPLAKGLFRRAIVQSGNTPKVNSAGTAERIGRRLAEHLGVEAKREAIAAISPEKVLLGQSQLRNELLANPDPAFWGEVALSFLPWAPTVDHQTIPEPPIERIIAGAGVDIDLLVGSNTEETRLFFVPGGAIDRISEVSLQALAGAYGLSREGLSAYRAAYPSASAGELFSAIQTDWYWRIPAVRMADAHARTARAATFMYEFAWRSPQLGGRLGAAHSMEIPFVFDTLGLATEPLLGPSPPQSLAKEMPRAWVAFAVAGDCGWPRYDAGRRSTMRFDTAPEVVENPLGSKLAVWNHDPQ
jgi:carboxylesterase type B